MILLALRRVSENRRDRLTGQTFVIGVGKAINLPSLRTVHAVFPHTALQLAVSISGQIDDSNLLQGASVIATE